MRQHSLAQVFIVLLALIGTPLLQGCSEQGPAEVYEEFITAIHHGDITRAASLTSSEWVTTLGSDDRVVMVLRAVAEDLQSFGGLEGLEVLSETVQGELAVVQIREHFGDGSTDEGEYRIVREDGQWRVGIIQ